MDATKINMFNKFLKTIEQKGNKLPHPVTILAIFALLTVIISAIFSQIGTSVEIQQIDKNTGEVQNIIIYSRSLLSKDGLRLIFQDAIKNFTDFAPLGVVLVAVLGISLSDKSGLLKAFLNKTLLNTPKFMISAMVIFAGIMSNIASDSGYVVVIPLAATAFIGLKRHPMAGMAAAFFGVSGGFSANILIGSIDPLLSGFSTEGARILQNDYYVSPMANYYFLFASTFIITVIGALITDYFVEPRLGKYNFRDSDSIKKLSNLELKGLRNAGISLLISIIFISLISVPKDAILQNDSGKDLLINSPFINSIVIIVAILFFIPGLCYGITTRKIKNDKDVIKMLSGTMNTMGSYIVLTFVAAQFVAYFKYSNLGVILAVGGANLLLKSNITGIPLLVLFIFLIGFLNFFIGSAVTKWSVMASVFIPMFMIMGFSPEVTQLAYRIGDSSTNIISPLMPFFAIVLTIMEKYDNKVGTGTIISTMLPYSIALIICWSILFSLWLLSGLPIGIGTGDLINYM